jgi:hypothetical protein
MRVYLPCSTHSWNFIHAGRGGNGDRKEDVTHFISALSSCHKPSFQVFLKTGGTTSLQIAATKNISGGRNIPLLQGASVYTALPRYEQLRLSSPASFIPEAHLHPYLQS